MVMRIPVWTWRKCGKKSVLTLILEKVLTKDVVIEEEAIEDNYKENTSIYNTLTTYRTAVIIVPSKEEAEQTLG